jgi:signal-transduction protein with cAMP-binding, CBS, and nucleotidyltransferase domain
MTAGGFGAVTVISESNEPIGIFTDGDLRRLIETEGTEGINKNVGDLELNSPLTIDSNEILFKAQEVFTENKVDGLVVTEKGKVVGMLDIQDLV